MGIAMLIDFQFFDLAKGGSGLGIELPFRAPAADRPSADDTAEPDALNPIEK